MVKLAELPNDGVVGVPAMVVAGAARLTTRSTVRALVFSSRRRHTRCLRTGVQTCALPIYRPVKYVYGRAEEMQVSSPRAAERLYVKDGVMADGTITARKVTMYVDAGAYSRHTPYGTTKAAAHMPGPYSIPNVWVDAHCVYTNRTPSSAMRGFGV